MNFVDWLIETGQAERTRTGQVLVHVPDYNEPLTLDVEVESLEPLWSDLEEGGKAIWGPSAKSARILAYQLLSVHIEEAVLSRSQAQPNWLTLRDGKIVAVHK